MSARFTHSGLFMRNPLSLFGGSLFARSSELWLSAGLCVKPIDTPKGDQCQRE